MTLSMKLAKDLLQQTKPEDLTINDLGFILTVFRDNTSDDDLHKLFHSVLIKMDFVFNESN